MVSELSPCAAEKTADAGTQAHQSAVPGLDVPGAVLVRSPQPALEVDGDGRDGKVVGVRHEPVPAREQPEQSKVGVRDPDGVGVVHGEDVRTTGHVPAGAQALHPHVLDPVQAVVHLRPQRAVAVGRHEVHLVLQGVCQAGEPAVLDQADAVAPAEAHPQRAARLGDQRVHVGLARYRAARRGHAFEGHAVEAVQAVLRTEPQGAVIGLRDGVDACWRAILCQPGGVLVLRDQQVAVAREGRARGEKGRQQGEEHQGAEREAVGVHAHGQGRQGRPGKAGEASTRARESTHRYGRDEAGTIPPSRGLGCACARETRCI